MPDDIRYLLPNDEPTEADHLEHARVVEEVARFVDQADPPYVLGVHGDWGAGKTSFLLKLRHRLTEGPTWRKCRVVFFEAWRHQFEEQPVIALLHTIRDHFSLDRRVWDKAGKLTSVTAWTGLRLLDDLIQGIGEAARSEGESWERAHYALPLASESFRSAFEAAIGKLTGSGDSKLVVLIDDLDRCSDAAVVRLLESIKLYLNAANCVFVIAADRRAVIRAIQRELFPATSAEDEPRQQRNASEYSDKLFQSVRSLPLANDMGALVHACWGVRAGPVDDAVEARVDGERQLLVRLQDQTTFLPPNPRKVKRFLVELHGRIAAWRARFPEEPDLVLACAVQALQTFHPDIYRVLVATPDFWAEIATFADHGPALQVRHPVFAGLVVPDRRAGSPTSGADSLAVPGQTFHDPGDVSVFWVARVVRERPTPPTRSLYRLLQGRDAPARPDDAADQPDATIEDILDHALGEDQA